MTVDTSGTSIHHFKQKKPLEVENMMMFIKEWRQPAAPLSFGASAIVGIFFQLHSLLHEVPPLDEATVFLAD